MLTVEQVQHALPPHLKMAGTQHLTDQLNALGDNPEVAEAIRDNFISYTKVLQEGKFKTQDYLNAVRFVSYKLMGYTNQDSYFRAFPDRHAALVADGRSSQEISAYVSMYAKGKLVNLILEQTLIPTHVLNADLHQRALNTLAHEMVTAKSEMVRVTAASNLANLLQKPKEVGPLINIDLRENSGMKEMKEAMKGLAQQQLAMIEAGGTAKQIAERPIIELAAKKDDR